MFTWLKGTDDGGFSLIEVVVAMAVFTVLATITAGLLINTTKVSADSTRRTTATNVLNSELETARSLTAQAIADGLTISTETVNGFDYKVTQQASYVGSSSTTSVCSGSGSSLAYKLVTVTVTWPNMGSIKPVRGDTLRAVGVGKDGLDATKGTLAIAIVGSTGQPTSGVAITLNPGGLVRTTGDDGCAIYTELTPGTYSATASTAGYVGKDNVQTATASSLAATAGTVSRASLLYDTERNVKVVFDGPVGAIVPSTLVLRAGNSYVAESTLPICLTGATSACTTAVPGTVSHLFPETYGIKAGACTEAAASQVAVDLRPSAANNTTVTVPMGAATVKVANILTPTTGIAGRTVTFTHAAPATGCTATDTLTLTTDAAGSAFLVPYGTWTVSVAGSLNQSVTFNASAKTATMTFLVVS